VQVSLFLKLKNTGKFATSSQNCMEVFVLNSLFGWRMAGAGLL
jgi:hypothetical protein